MSEKKNWLLWEIFICSKNGFNYKYVGSFYVVDVEMVIENVCDVYMCCMEGISIWVVEFEYIMALSFN